MKRSNLLLLPFLCVSLSSCSFLFGMPNGNYVEGTLEERKFEVYDLLGIEEEGVTTSGELLMETQSLYFSSEVGEVPFINLEDYATLLSHSYKKGYTNEYAYDGRRSESLTVKDEKEEPIYMIVIDYRYSSFSYAGDITQAFDFQATSASSSLGMQTEVDSKIAKEPRVNYYSRSFASNTIPAYNYDSKFYLPLAILDNQIGGTVGNHYFYGGDALYRYDRADDLVKHFVSGGNTKSAISFWEAYYEENHAMPKGMAAIDNDVLLFFMENEYGLKSDKIGSTTFREFYKSKGIMDNLGSDDPIKHTQALIDAFAWLDDDHSGITNISSWWGEDFSSIAYRRGANSIKRNATYANLSSLRNDAFENEGVSVNDIRYSNSGELASISFDHFSYTTSAYDEETGELNEDLYLQDTYFFLLHQLNEIKEKGGVKNVLLDLSLNEGGTIGTMYGMLPLLSKDDSSLMYLSIPSIGLIWEIETKVDSNQDGVYDSKDVFGNDFDFLILVSDCSFSCGNSFPFLAKKQGFARILGTKSGGGECSVFSAMLPSGHGISFSSSLHFGWYEDNKFEGNEPGVKADIELKNEEFYDLEAIEQKIA